MKMVEFPRVISDQWWGLMKKDGCPIVLSDQRCWLMKEVEYPGVLSELGG